MMQALPSAQAGRERPSPGRKLEEQFLPDFDRTVLGVLKKMTSSQ
jgi:hypothetical protein